jgi:two-component system cell cycle sensor histidine kinase/response regulator CckA
MAQRFFVVFNPWSLAAFAMLFVAPPASFSAAQAQPLPEVLVLHSYHQGLPWTDSVTDGIRAGFEAAGLDVHLNIEYMDTMRHDPYAFVLPHLENLYAAKFENTRFDIVIASDNNAFDFLKHERGRLFEGVPVVFCGLDDFKDPQIDGIDNVTGVNEMHEIHGTIKLALRLHPGTERIAVINDLTRAGARLQTHIDKIIASKEYPVKFISLSGMPAEELALALQRLPEKTIILHLNYFRDRNNKPHELRDSVALLTENCRLPAYTCWDWRVGKGFLGGLVTSGRMQGEIAAQKAAEVLRGAPADSVPILYRSPNTPMFDFNELKRFGISLTDLPADSVIVNRPVSFYKRYKAAILIFGGTSAFLFVIVVILAVHILYRRRAVADLRKSEERYRNLFEGSGDAVYITSAKGVLIDGNQALLDLMGASKEDIGRLDVREIYADPEDREKFLEIMARDGQVRDHPLRLRAKNGEIRECLVNSILRSGKPGDGAEYQGIVRDVTEQKRMEEALRSAERLAAIGQTIGDIAHRMKGILSRTLGGISIINQGKDRLEAGSETWGIINRSATDLKVLVEKMLAVSVDRRPRLRAEDLNAIAEDLVRVFGPQAAYAGVALEWKPAKDLPECFCDAEGVSEAASYLVENAIEVCSGIDGGKVVIETREGNDDGFLCLEVRDNGPGVAEEIREKLFIPFESTKGYTGHGLGLAIAIKTAVEHNGALDFESVPGDTRFFLRLPRHLPSEPNQDSQP